MPDDRPTRTLAVVLGASTFPNAPKLAEGRAFYISAADIVDYLRGEGGMGLPRRNVLSLFDDSRSPSDQLIELAGFLTRRDLELKSDGACAEDLLIYYVGHGLFARGDQAYCLAIRCTNEINEGATSIRAADLAGVIKENAAFLRRYLILDCCFSASIYKEFQSSALTTARVQIAAEFPERGTALLCSSSARDPSLAPQGLEHTMFSNALLEALRKGHPAAGRWLSFSELGDIIKEKLRTEYRDTWVRPEVHSPDQREGDIASIPLFPNPAHRQREAEEQKAREAGEKLRQQAAERDAADAARAAVEEKAAHEAAARRKAEQERLAREAVEAKRSAEERAAAEEKAAHEAAARQRAEQERLAREAAEAKRIAEVRVAVADGPAEKQPEENATGTRLRLKKLWIPALVCFALLVLTIWAAQRSHQPDQKGLTPVSSEHFGGTSQTNAGKGSAPSSQPDQDVSRQLNKTHSAVEASQETSAEKSNKMLSGDDLDLASRFTVGGPDSAPTILDTKSGLMWTRKDYWNINGRYLASWNEAMQFAVTCNTESYAGYRDWHVPTIAEYRTINASKTDRLIAARIFEKTDASIYWASNTPSPFVASYIGFEINDGGYAVSGERTEHQFFNGSIMPMGVRLVRRAK